MATEVVGAGASEVRTERPVFFPNEREKAYIFEEQEECSRKIKELYHCMELPTELLPLTDIIESGWSEESGFSWIVTSRTQRLHFPKSDRHCSYDEVVTCTITKGHMSNIRGVKAKEFGIWVPINEIYVDNSKPNNKKLVFKR